MRAGAATLAVCTMSLSRVHCSQCVLAKRLEPTDMSKRAIQGLVGERADEMLQGSDPLRHELREACNAAWAARRPRRFIRAAWPTVHYSFDDSGLLKPPPLLIVPQRLGPRNHRATSEIGQKSDLTQNCLL